MAQDTVEAMRRRIIVALDVADGDAAEAVAVRLRGSVGLIKVGLELFVAEGPAVVRRLRAAVPELDVFLDLKLHDIPNTMVGAIRAARSLGARFVTVHAGSGVAHLQACVDAAGPGLGVLAVTVLTSQDAEACVEAGHTRGPSELVAVRARCARAAGCAGVVCSGQELAVVREPAAGLVTVVPGIRPAGGEVGDQKRVMTPGQAIAAGASYLVIGRPIVAAADPVAAAGAIARDMADGDAAMRRAFAPLRGEA
jgi:orotidine-5'-phosphate decarboxylase